MYEISEAPSVNREKGIQSTDLVENDRNNQ